MHENEKMETTFKTDLKRDFVDKETCSNTDSVTQVCGWESDSSVWCLARETDFDFNVQQVTQETANWQTVWP